MANNDRKGVIAVRVGIPFIWSEENLERTVRFFKRHKEAVDELAFFTEHVHGYMPIEKFAEHIGYIERAMNIFRREGFRVGINVLNTMGHLDEAPERSVHVPWQKMVGMDGEVARLSSCPADKAFLADVAKRYALAAGTNPHFIWVDDDIRMRNHPPVEYGCFCEACIADFSKSVGKKFTRTSLRSALRKETWPTRHRLREAWVKRNLKMLGNLMRVIERACHRVDPGIELGLMTASALCLMHCYDGARHGRLLFELSGGGKVPVRLRPGGRFYLDDRPVQMVEKALLVADQVADVTESPAGELLSTIQYELENFPYHKLGKSVRTVLLENTLGLAAGCTGIACNILSDKIEDSSRLLAAIGKKRAFWEMLARETDGMPLVGLNPAVSRKAAYIGRAGDDWPNLGQFQLEQSYRMLSEVGLPLTMSPGSACAVVVRGVMITNYTRKEIIEILKGGVILDGEALEAFEKMGLAHLAGVRAEKIPEGGVQERLTEHPLNGKFAGYFRDARMGFFGGQAYNLVPLDEKVEIISHNETQYNEHLGIGATAFTNKLGGRAVVYGYEMWINTHNEMKYSQIREIADWISRGKMPIRIDECVRVVPFVRAARNRRRIVAVLLNASLDPTGPITVRLRTKARKFMELTPSGKMKKIPRTKVERLQNEVRIRFPSLQSWSLAVIIGKE